MFKMSAISMYDALKHACQWSMNVTVSSSTSCELEYSFLLRDTMRSLLLSDDHLSRWCIVSTWLKISSNFFLGPVAPSF